MAKDDLDPPHMQPELPGLFPRRRRLEFDRRPEQAAGATDNTGARSLAREALIDLMRAQLNSGPTNPDYQVVRDVDWETLTHYTSEAVGDLSQQWRRVNPPPQLTAQELIDMQHRRHVELHHVINQPDLPDPPVMASADDGSALEQERDDLPAVLQARQPFRLLFPPVELWPTPEPVRRVRRRRR